MKLNWRMWQSLATKESVKKARAAGVPKLNLPKAAKAKLINPHRGGPRPDGNGPHSNN